MTVGDQRPPWRHNPQGPPTRPEGQRAARPTPQRANDAAGEPPGAPLTPRRDRPRPGRPGLGYELRTTSTTHLSHDLRGRYAAGRRTRRGSRRWPGWRKASEAHGGFIKKPLLNQGPALQTRLRRAPARLYARPRGREPQGQRRRRSATSTPSSSIRPSPPGPAPPAGSDWQLAWAGTGVGVAGSSRARGAAWQV